MRQDGFLAQLTDRPEVQPVALPPEYYQDGTGQRTVVAGNRGKNPNYRVHWSPHRTHLIYEMDVDGIGGIYCFVYRVSVDGSGNTALTTKSESPAWPAGWSE